VYGTEFKFGIGKNIGNKEYTVYHSGDTEYRGFFSQILRHSRITLYEYHKRYQRYIDEEEIRTAYDKRDSFVLDKNSGSITCHSCGTCDRYAPYGVCYDNIIGPPQTEIAAEQDKTCRKIQTDNKKQYHIPSPFKYLFEKSL
jgi:hypothetical protein